MHTSILLDTVIHNYNAIIQGSTYFFQRGSWTNRLSSENRLEFEEIIRAFLEKTDKKARNLIVPFEESYTSDNQITAGIGLFYFEDASNSELE